MLNMLLEALNILEGLGINKQEEFMKTIYMLSQGYTKTDVSEEVGVSRPTLSRWSMLMKDLETKEKLCLICGSCCYEKIKKVETVGWERNN